MTYGIETKRKTEQPRYCSVFFMVGYSSGKKIDMSLNYYIFLSELLVMNVNKLP